ncbi:MAG TPA: hypothetical protein DCM31_06550 [Deferribacteraceae bacterium]|nr:hypothetical protein [Deferribacteraceae bacterium]
MSKSCKLTDELIKICVENVKLGMSYSACAKAIGVTYQTWRNWITNGEKGKEPYAKFYIEIQKAEAELMKECLESVKLSMKLGDVKSAMFILEKRFGSDGFGKSVQVNSVNENVNVNVTATQDENDKIRREILSKLAPREKIF